MSRPQARDPRSPGARFGAGIGARLCGTATALAGALLLAGCDIPTSLPNWDTTFVVQSENTSLAVAQLLPASVTITNNEFAISVSPVSFSQDLAGLCSSCSARAAETGSRPAFLGSFESSIGLPADVASASLVEGRLNVTLKNGLSFDPLRADGDLGSLTITARSGAVVIGTKVITGATDALPPGERLTVAVPVKGEVDEKLSVSVEVSAPGEDDVDELSGKLDVTVSPSGLRAKTARFYVQARHITAAPVRLKLASIDKGIINGARSGAILLSLTNPLGVGGTLTLRITGGAKALSKPVAIKPGTTEVDVPFDASELKSFLGYNATMTLAGSVSAKDDVALTPGQVITVASRLKLILATKD